MNVELYNYYNAVINYHRTDDLKPDVTPNESETIVSCVWIADENEKFAGEYIFTDAKTGYNMPLRDLNLISESTFEEYYKLSHNTISQKFKKY